jgi:hypothetical protein
MPLEISTMMKDTFGWSFSSRGLNNLFSNKLYTSMILTILILILIMNIYPCKKGTSAHITFKLGFYILMTSLAIIFIHDGILHGLYEKNKIGGDEESFINALSSGNNTAFKNDNTTIKPNLSGNLVGGDGIIGDNVSCIRVGGDTTPHNDDSNDSLFKLYGV